MNKNEIALYNNVIIGPCIPAKARRGYKKMTVHIIFYVKLDAGLTRKLTLVTDRNKVNTPPLMRYSYILSRVSVIIVLMIATLNVLDVKCTDIQNV